MGEIMVRLPVKSLLRFKCVAKSWYALITDPSFIAKHLERSKSITNGRSRKLIFYGYRVDRPPYITLISKDQPYCVPQYLEPLPRLYCTFYGQCNGIFCLHVLDPTDVNENVDHDDGDEGNLILWNPTTKEDKLIPLPQCQPKAIFSNMFGFGFDPITKDYKVVQVSHPPLEGGVRLVEVYNLSTNSWRMLDVVVPAAFDFYVEDCKTYLNGVYHWYIYDPSGIRKNFILSFDFTREVFGTIQLPSATDSYYCGHNVFVLDESLAILQHDWETRKSKIWVMKEYGVESSWTNKFDVERFQSLPPS
ncbi:F-box/kelch-repeat protein At3g23880-like [Neltuma alba]|uniref:F-box/kelch-repeat protein At3g23880-like n=1 Tax=Neltuma alba TaxID=207710 RepID=UPI0010A4C280|nr:F-box/kelch-repeat protein At3g23880-like [Prosopis alba]